jgi:hypothetical protein
VALVTPAAARSRLVVLDRPMLACSDQQALETALTLALLHDGPAADQGRDCGAAEIQRIAENAPRWPDINSLVQPSSTWPSSRSPSAILVWLEAL